MNELVQDCQVEEYMEDDNYVIKLTNVNDGALGFMKFYEVMDGMMIVINEFHMHSVKSNFEAKSKLFCIDYCLEGKIEQEQTNNTVSYMQSGDTKLDSMLNHNTNFYFPLKHYIGITVGLDIDKAQASIDKLMLDFPFKIKDFKDKFNLDKEIYFVRNDAKLDLIFKDIYYADKEFKRQMIKVKVLELLLNLGLLDFNKDSKKVMYFYKYQIEKVKALHKYLSENLDNHDTLDDLSAKFDISLTNMKLCFKEVYGQPIHSYLRSLRMKKASELLQSSDEDIVDIATAVGYDNASKFSAAFKKEIGVLPNAYRKVSKGGNKNE